MADPRFTNPEKPTCSTCGKRSDVHAAPLPDVIPGTHAGYRWLCASCEYLESHPNADLRDKPKQEVIQLSLDSPF